eukprot:193584_1
MTSIAKKIVSKTSINNIKHKYYQLCKYSTNPRKWKGIPTVPPIVTSATFAFDTVDDAEIAVDRIFANDNDNKFNNNAHFYTRWHNPTTECAEDALNDMEHGYGTLLFSSGMNAIASTLLSILKYDNHIILPSNVYCETAQFVNTYLINYGINIDFVDTTQVNMHDIINDYENIIIKNKNKTKLIFCETPNNP